MALFWAGDALAAWAGLAAFGVLMNGAALLVGYCTGMLFTRRTAPLAGAGTLTLILPLTIWASGAPLATAITGVAAYRGLCFWLPLPPALASLPVLRQTTRQATITRQQPSSPARTPAAASPARYRRRPRKRRPFTGTGPIWPAGKNTVRVCAFAAAASDLIHDHTAHSPVSASDPHSGASGLPVQPSGTHISGRNALPRTAHPAGSSAAPIRQGECRLRFGVSVTLRYYR